MEVVIFDLKCFFTAAFFCFTHTKTPNDFYFGKTGSALFGSGPIDTGVEKMAASAATASSSPGLCPNYAVICSFLERYGALLDLPELTFPQLERYLRDTSTGEAEKHAAAAGTKR